LSSAFTHCRELMKIVGVVVIVKFLLYILLLMVPEQVWDWHFCSYQCVFCVFRFVFCLPLFGSFCGFLRKC
jgi:hypothetical protein